jgi:hypothetical protein
MSPRLQHALRFALPTFVTTMIVAVAYEVVRAILRGPPGDVSPDVRPTAGLAATLPTWAAIAAALTAGMFLLRLSDVVARPPSWTFAWLEAMWVALACVLAVDAVADGRPGRAAGIVVGAVVLWIAVHRRIPGWPGATAAGLPRGRVPDGERDLP